MKFDASRATLKGPDMFKRFQVSEDGESLAGADIDPEKEIIIFERGSEHRALIVSQMAYHHVAQGELAGAPYLITF